MTRWGGAPGMATGAVVADTPSPPLTSTVGEKGTRPLASLAGSESPDFTEMGRYMLELINADRASNGLLLPVEWDELAAEAGRRHAEEMVRYGYFSHWNLAGLGPDLRYALAGGTDYVMENIFSHWQRYDDGSPVPVLDWRALVRDSEEGLMNSPPHRANILTPAHTHVGVGMAYDPATGEFRLAQEFINRYTAMDPLPPAAAAGAELTVGGALFAGASQPLVNLMYEPFPAPMSVEELNVTGSYSSSAAFVAAVEPDVDAQGEYVARVRLPSDASPGYYHLHVWAEVGGESAPVAGAVVLIR